MTGLIYRIYRDAGIDRLVCKVIGHSFQQAGWHAKSCTRCPAYVM